MIDIILLILLTIQIGKIVRARGYRSFGYQVMTVFFWLGGELLGYSLASQLLGGKIELSTICPIILLSLSGAAIGGLTSFLIASNLPVKLPPPGLNPDPLNQRGSDQPGGNASAQAGQPRPAPTGSENRQAGMTQPAPAAGNRLPPSLPGTPQSVPTAIADGSLLASYLEQAEMKANSGMLEGAARMLDQGARISYDWGPALAGYPKQTSQPQSQPPSGFGLLIKRAGELGRKDLALVYFRRMLDLNPAQPTLAFQAAISAGIEPEARVVAQERGINWQ